MRWGLNAGMWGKPVDDTILEASIDDGRLFGAAELLEPAAGFELLESHGVERICYFHLNDSCAAF